MLNLSHVSNCSSPLEYRDASGVAKKRTSICVSCNSPRIIVLLRLPQSAELIVAKVDCDRHVIEDTGFALRTPKHTTIDPMD